MAARGCVRRAPRAIPRAEIGPDLGERRRLPVALREDRIPERPWQSELGIVPCQRAFQLRRVVGVMLVADVGRIAHDLEAVGTAGRNEHLTMRLVVEPELLPAAEGRGPWPKIDHNLEYRPARAPRELRLAQVFRHMKTTQGPPARPRLVLLDKRAGVDAPSLKNVG